MGQGAFFFSFCCCPRDNIFLQLWELCLVLFFALQLRPILDVVEFECGELCWIYPPPPHTLTATTRIIPFLVGNPYKPLFVTVTGWGVDRRNLHNSFPGNTNWAATKKKKTALLSIILVGLIGILAMVHDIPHVTGKNSGPECRGK